MGQYSEEEGKRGHIGGKTGKSTSCQVLVIIFLNQQATCCQGHLFFFQFHLIPLFLFCLPSLLVGEVYLIIVQGF